MHSHTALTQALSNKLVNRISHFVESAAGVTTRVVQHFGADVEREARKRVGSSINFVRIKQPFGKREPLFPRFADNSTPGLSLTLVASGFPRSSSSNVRTLINQ
jgi:hypothetical protein